jgi:predicted 2-oxoglutarate/Fe(II)-dependent dioxygenase YbiX
MKVKELATCINLYENAFDANDFIKTVNNEISNDWSEISWKNSSIGTGTVGNYRTSSEAEVGHLEKSNSELGRQFQSISNAIINDILEDYKKEHLVFTSGYEGWRLLKYSGGAEYHAHYDHSSINSRIISIVAFLEEPESGGELEFPFFGVSIKPKAGSVVLFPANFPYVHIAHPVTSGTKCSLVTWLQ